MLTVLEETPIRGFSNLIRPGPARQTFTTWPKCHSSLSSLGSIRQRFGMNPLKKYSRSACLPHLDSASASSSRVSSHFITKGPAMATRGDLTNQLMGPKKHSALAFKRAEALAESLYPMNNKRKSCSSLLRRTQESRGTTLMKCC